MKSASPSSAQAQIGSSPGSGETVSSRLMGTKLASSRNRLMILPINGSLATLARPGNHYGGRIDKGGLHLIDGEPRK